MASWRAEILAGIDSIPRVGTPGTIIVFGDDSEPILTNETGQVLIAAAEVGEGRVVVFSHGGYTKEFLKKDPRDEFVQLLKNTKSWVTRNGLTSESEIENADSYSDFEKIPSTCKLLVWTGTKVKGDTYYEKLMAWLKEGGALVCGTTPWGYLQGGSDRTLDTMPLYFVLKAIDVAYTAGYLSGSGDVEVSENQAKNAHLLTAIKSSKDDIKKLLEHEANINAAIENLPEDALSKISVDITDMVEHHAATWHCIPSKGKPIKTPEGRALTAIMCHLYIRRGEYNNKTVAPNIEEFPGNFLTPPTLLNVSVTATNKSQPATSYPTGFYLPAGQKLTVTRTTTNSKTWNIIIGAHSDKLYNKRDKNWRRWPHIQVVASLKKEKTTVQSAFGGLVYLRCPSGVDDTLGVSLEGVTRAPLLDPSRSSTVGDWVNRRDDPGLWGDVAGEAVVITLPSSTMRDLPDPTLTMVWWDSVWRAHIDLRGVDPHGGRREWVVADEQPSAGSMHSGYPIVTNIGVADPDKVGENPFLLNYDELRKNGAWGVFHELGHNIQDSKWTFSGTGEVTCNIFTLHAMDVITGQKPWIHPWLQRQMVKIERYLVDGADFNEWKKQAGTALAIYAQLARDFGWKTYKAVFREYNGLPPDERPSGDDEKIDQWIVRFSKEAGKNLCPVFDFWGFPIRASVLADLKHLKNFLHSDETTNDMAPVRAAEIRRKYGMAED